MNKHIMKRGVNKSLELPNHAYHPNVALRHQQPKGYIAWPTK